MLGHRLRRWSNIKPVFFYRLVLTRIAIGAAVLGFQPIFFCVVGFSCCDIVTPEMQKHVLYCMARMVARRD